MSRPAYDGGPFLDVAPIHNPCAFCSAPADSTFTVARNGQRIRSRIKVCQDCLTAIKNG